MKRVVLRLLLSCAVGGAAWVGMASALLAWLLPAVDPGTDDLGVGLVAACIFVPTLYLAAVGVVAFNVLAWRADLRRHHRCAPAFCHEAARHGDARRSARHG